MGDECGGAQQGERTRRSDDRNDVGVGSLRSDDRNDVGVGSFRERWEQWESLSRGGLLSPHGLAGLCKGWYMSFRDGGVDKNAVAGVVLQRVRYDNSVHRRSSKTIRKAGDSLGSTTAGKRGPRRREQDNNSCSTYEGGDKHHWGSAGIANKKKEVDGRPDASGGSAARESSCAEKEKSSVADADLRPDIVCRADPEKKKRSEGIGGIAGGLSPPNGGGTFSIIEDD